MELTFNIVYTPGTVEYLCLFALSLLKWSDCSFRLVANGCSSRESHLLRVLCRRNPRFEFLALPARKPIDHGQALSYLQSMERSDIFCFVDSDILATGDFVSELVPYLSQYVGVFSGFPVWCRREDTVLPEAFPRMVGRFSRTEKGVCLGSSYFAVYNNRALTSIIQETGIGFELRRWSDIPAQWQCRLAGMGLRKKVYDTGKVLNLLLLDRREQLVCVESLSLQHLGGISTHISYKDRPLRERFLAKLKMLRRRVRSRFRQLAMRDPALAGASAAMRRVGDKEARAVRHFVQVLHALFQDRPLPPAPHLGDPEVERRIELATRAVVSTYEEFRAQLL